MIVNNSPKGEGYLACMRGKSLEDNPYIGIDGTTIYNWYDWVAGWYQAWNENKFGVE